MDYYWLFAIIVIYALVLVLWPGIRQAWLIFGGTMLGAFLIPWIGLVVIGLFWHGYAAMGLTLWLTLPLAAVGGVGGFLLALFSTLGAKSHNRTQGD